MSSTKAALPFNPKQFEEFVVILTGGVLAGSSGIGYNPATGQIIHIPGNNPEAFELIRLGFQSLQVATLLEDAELKKDLLKHSARLVQEGQTILERTIKGAAGRAA